MRHKQMNKVRYLVELKATKCQLKRIVNHIET
jgi:hypothetical protein